MTKTLRVIKFGAWGLLAFVALAIGLGAILERVNSNPSAGSTGSLAIGGAVRIDGSHG